MKPPRLPLMVEVDEDWAQVAVLLSTGKSFPEENPPVLILAGII